MDNLENLSRSLDKIKEHLSGFELTMSIVVALAVAAVTVFVVLFFGVWKLRTKVLPSQTGAPRKLRFRKRDKVLFYGRKMLRQVRSFTRNFGPAKQGKLKKRQIVMKLAKKLLQLKRKPSQPQLRFKEPPQSFLDTDSSEIEESDHRLPPEVLYMLRSTRVFGHFEKPLFLELVKHMETKVIPHGEYLFKIGDSDDSIYVVQDGLINVSISESESQDYLVKEVKTGDSVHSLLSILDVLTGHKSPYKTVSAQAQVDSTVLKLPATAFQSLFERFPESLVRIVQIIMIRLQRVTFTALHNYLGLSSELMNPQVNLPVENRFPPNSRMYQKRHSISVFPNSKLDASQSLSRGLSSQHSPHKKYNRENSTNKDILTLRDSASHKESSILRETTGQRDVDSVPEEAEIPHKSEVFRQKSAMDDIDGEKMKSDFDTACMRARVTSLDVPGRSFDDNAATSAQSVRSRQKRFSDSLTLMTQSSIDASDEAVVELARKELIKLLKLKDESLLDGKLLLKKVKAGTTVISQGDQDASLIFIVKGTMKLLQQIVGKQEKEALLFNAHPGEMVGALAVLTGEPSFFTIRAKTDARLVIISKNNFYSIMREQPSVVLDVAHTTVIRMTPFVRQIDFALDWILIEAGKALFRQGDRSDSIYIVLTGRLRSVITKRDGKKELVGEYGRGELVGIVEVLTDSERTTTIMAVRDTECAKLPAELLNLIKRKFPQIVTRLIHLLGQRLLGQLQTKSSGSLTIGDNDLKDQATTKNLATVAVLPITKDVPLTSFTLELQFHLAAIGSTMRLTSEIVKQNLGLTALDSVNEFRLLNWLGQQEDMHRMTLYQCDYTMTKWTKNCIRQADCILIVGLADGDPAVGETEQQMEHMGVRAQKELILLHKDDADTPQGTIEWLNARGWLSSHHHIRCPKRVLTKRSELKIAEFYEKQIEKEPDRMSDFSRLARFLTGTSIGVVLGGGGARGLSHVGLIRSLVEAKIPIDMVGGTSMGAFIGGLWCEDCNITSFYRRSREFSKEMTSLWKKILDLTYPVTSMFSGKAFNDSIEEVFKHRQIEDLWIPYFCITTDISSSCMRVHRHGSLWRYIRSSMSLSGYLPPLCDPIDGHLLLDGGYVNNLPADVIKQQGAQNIFAIDVGSQDETDLTNYGDHLSGWWLLWKRWNPWAEPVKVPHMAEIQARLAYVSCVRQLEMVKDSDFCEYIRPPIDKYGTLQFGSCDEIMEVGYNHGKTFLSGWIKGGLIANLFKDQSALPAKGHLHKVETNMPVLAKFTDLAELISTIEEPNVSRKSSFDSVDYEYNEETDDSYEEEEIIMEEDEGEGDNDEDSENNISINVNHNTAVSPSKNYPKYSTKVQKSNNTRQRKSSSEKVATFYR